MKRFLMVIVGLFGCCFTVLLVLVLIGSRLGGDSPASDKNQAPIDTLAQLARGEYLVKAANCVGCHTEQGGSPFVGGRILQSEFGEFVTPNITPDKRTGIGNWSADDFWQALHNGRGLNGKLLYPAFPFTNYSLISRADSDAMFAYFSHLQPISKENQEHKLSFPVNQRWLICAWRTLFFRPQTFAFDEKKSKEWNRGAYLVEGLGHCSACHSSRNFLGANKGNRDFSGGEMPKIFWYAPAFASSLETNLSSASIDEVQTLLSAGLSSTNVVNGPMAEVVKNSLQYLSSEDSRAMAVYLKELPQEAEVQLDALDRALEKQGVSENEMNALMASGAKLYEKHCVECHGVDGEGVPLIYPKLKGNAAVLMSRQGNALRIVLAGGFAPSTMANPRPYGMPPFAPLLSDAEIALVSTYIRNAWGNRALPVLSSDVNPYRTAPQD